MHLLDIPFLSLAFLTHTVLSDAPSSTQTCKTLPSDIPRSTWDALNSTLSGALLVPTPPGAVCHPSQPSYNSTLCPAIQAGWNTDWSIFVDSPIQGAYTNWDNDSCWPFPAFGLPCDSLGFPEYVVNASTAAQVQAAVNFARQKNVRLVVKATGHDFRGRSVAPKSLSIWVRHLKGLTFHDKFEPKGGCDAYGSGGPALTIAAGENHGTAFAEAAKHDMMINVGGGPTVAQGGYALGGGHSLISHKYGLGVDNILELQVVTPDGKVVVANACQNKGLFWGLRGGGGSVLGVVLNLTVRTFPMETFVRYSLSVDSVVNSTKFWDALAYVAGEMPRLSDSGIQSYTFALPGNETVGSTIFNGFGAPGKPLDEVKALLDPLANYINETYADELFVSTTTTENSTLYGYWVANPDVSTPMGIDVIVGSRILDAKALQRLDFKEKIQNAWNPAGLQLFLVSGPGVHKFKADSSAVLPAWRTGYVHLCKFSLPLCCFVDLLTIGIVAGTGWPPKNATEKAHQINQMTNVTEAAMREIAPDTGAYMNEVSDFPIHVE
jgi:hypothetical protein